LAESEDFESNIAPAAKQSAESLNECEDGFKHCIVVPRIQTRQ
jgi:hypothetical protein